MEYMQSQGIFQKYNLSVLLRLASNTFLMQAVLMKIEMEKTNALNDQE